jgi:hypothetical protein
VLNKKALFLFWLAAFSPTFAAETQTITVKSSQLIQGKVRSFEVDLKERSVEMFCFVSSDTCKDLPPGKYLMVPSPTGNYQDSDDVDIYPDGAGPTKNHHPIGTYGLPWP